MIKIETYFMKIKTRSDSILYIVVIQNNCGIRLRASAKDIFLQIDNPLSPLKNYQ